MQNQSPVELGGLIIADAKKVDIGAVDEAALAVEPGHPHRHWRRIRDQPKPFLALPERRFGKMAVGDVIALGEDAANPPGIVEDGLEDEVEKPFLERSSSLALKLDRHREAGKWLAA